jgi:hypothetical protein
MGYIQNSFGWYDSPNSYFKYPYVTFFACLYFGCHLCFSNNYRFKTTSLPSASSLEIIHKMSNTANSSFVWLLQIMKWNNNNDVKRRTREPDESNKQLSEYRAPLYDEPSIVASSKLKVLTL